MEFAPLSWRWLSCNLTPDRGYSILLIYNDLLSCHWSSILWSHADNCTPSTEEDYEMMLNAVESLIIIIIIISLPLSLTHIKTTHTLTHICKQRHTHTRLIGCDSCRSLVDLQTLCYCVTATSRCLLWPWSTLSQTQRDQWILDKHQNINT